MNLKLSIAMTLNARTRPLLDGTVKADGIDLPATVMFWRQLKFADFEHGIKTNRAVLETIARYSHEQGLTPRVIPIEGVFAASTMDV